MLLRYCIPYLDRICEETGELWLVLQRVHPSSYGIDLVSVSLPPRLLKPVQLCGLTALCIVSLPVCRPNTYEMVSFSSQDTRSIQGKLFCSWLRDWPMLEALA